MGPGNLDPFDLWDDSWRWWETSLVPPEPLQPLDDLDMAFLDILDGCLPDDAVLDVFDSCFLGGDW